ncbi:unnamed protein product [Mytilus coruscus]|uniref:Uncharacterized protein n=1 Tax=Mytilus coruscus TaxID=42192 RepID=A0A6J8BEK5_MYTCO|nr:unnamed protein product [Mytilus coruscus]
MGRPKRKTATTTRASTKEYEYNEFSDMDGDDLHKSNSDQDPIDKPDINYEVNYEIKNEKEDPCYDRKQELLRDCKCLTESVRKPLNVAIIGPPGCGKSSFLNTVFASLNSDRWYEYAKCGHFGNHEDVMGMEISRHLRRKKVSALSKERKGKAMSEQVKHIVIEFLEKEKITVLHCQERKIPKQVTKKPNRNMFCPIM